MGTRARQQPSSVSCYATAVWKLGNYNTVGLIFFPSLGYLVDDDGTEPSEPRGVRVTAGIVSLTI